MLRVTFLAVAWLDCSSMTLLRMQSLTFVDRCRRCSTSAPNAGAPLLLLCCGACRHAVRHQQHIFYNSIADSSC